MLSTPLVEDDFHREMRKRSGPRAVWRHVTTRGHKGRVNCVATSDHCNYVVSGGEDYTMRVWEYDKILMSYDLCAVQQHDNVVNQPKSRACSTPHGFWHSKTSDPLEEENCLTGVTAVGCIGQGGPIISGTSEGALCVFYMVSETCGMGGGCVSLPQIHTASITAIATPLGLGDMRNSDEWFMATTSEDTTASLFFVRKRFKHITLPHQGPVLGAAHVDSGGQQGIRWATYTHDSIFLWSLYGQQLRQLQPLSTTLPQESSGISGVTINNVDRPEALLFVGHSGNLSVWGFEHGDLCGPYGGPANGNEPLYTYPNVRAIFDVDKSRHTTRFIVDLHDDFNCVVSSLTGRQTLAIKPQGPAGLLVNAQHLRPFLDLRHAARVTQLLVAEDPNDAEGPCLLAACNNGSVHVWDLHGKDRGEIQADLRSLQTWEFLLPLFLVMVSFVQLTALAFGPEIGWRDEVQVPATITRRLVLGEINWAIAVPRNEIYMPVFWSVICVMLFFLLLALTGTPQLLSLASHGLRSTKRYKEESSKQMRPVHKLRQLLGMVQEGIAVMMWLAATILVAPTFRFSARALDCVGDPLHLVVAPQVLCYRGSHATMSMLIRLVAPLYFLVLLPHVIVDGSVKYMTIQKMIRPYECWGDAAVRKATKQSFGPLHPNPKFILTTTILDYMAKAVLPVIEVFTSRQPQLQMALLSCMTGILWATSVVCPPKSYRVFTSVVQHTRFLTFAAMICGWLAVQVGRHSHLPTVLLCVCFAVVPIRTVVMLRYHELVAPSVQYCQTSGPLSDSLKDGKAMVTKNDMFMNYMVEHSCASITALQNGLLRRSDHETSMRSF